MYEEIEILAKRARAASMRLAQTSDDERNGALYDRYVQLVAEEGDVVFAGRLGGYKYYDMDKAIDAAFDLVKAELGVDVRA